MEAIGQFAGREVVVLACRGRGIGLADGFRRQHAAASQAEPPCRVEFNLLQGGFPAHRTAPCAWEGPAAQVGHEEPAVGRLDDVCVSGALQRMFGMVPCRQHVVGGIHLVGPL